MLDAPGGQDWGNYDAAYPVQVLPATSPAVSATVAWARAHMVQGLPTYANGTSLHDYLGFSVFQTELAAGDTSDAVAGLYSELVHTTSTDAGWEWSVAPFGPRASAVDLAPHGTFAGDYVALLRNLLVDELPGGGVTLLRGASPAWLEPGQHITVTGAPTDRGLVSFTERSSTRGETLTWSEHPDPGHRSDVDAAGVGTARTHPAGTGGRRDDPAARRVGLAHGHVRWPSPSAVLQAGGRRA